VPDHDLLVGGFPCQPFSSMGEQRGLEDWTSSAGHRGMLYTQIVRILTAKRPKAFLLENVPGLVHSNGGRDLDTICTALTCHGCYDVTVEVITSRGLTAQSRKRLFLVGLLRQTPAPVSSAFLNDGSDATTDAVATNRFEFPYIPDLGLRAGDILDHDHDNGKVLSPNISLLSLSNDQFHSLRTRCKSKWKPAKLAWWDTVCDTLDSHYGNSVGRGNSQLVPCWAAVTPSDCQKSQTSHLGGEIIGRPRKFSPRECSRLMGFSNLSFQFDEPTSGNELRKLYHMLGNAVCPPVVAAVAGAILDHIQRAPPQKNSRVPKATTAGRICGSDTNGNNGGDWASYGRIVAVELALDAVHPDRRDSVSARVQQQFGGGQQ
jgi:DNA (cytosine-5)-methyltransferase 1